MSVCVLSELKRVEIERGADSPGVKLGIFPAATGPSISYTAS